MSSVFRRLRYVLFRSRHDLDLRDEIEAHRRLRQEALERNGVAPEQAADASRRALGNVTLAIDEVRDVWTIRLIDGLWLDVRLAWRGLRRSPGFALVAVGTLALGIGANTAIFSVINAAFFAPYEVREPGRLVRLWGQDLKRNIVQLGFSVPKYELIRDQQTAFTAFGAATQLPQTLLLNGAEPIQVNGSVTTSSFLDAFGAAPIAGRFFRSDEERGAFAAVVGEELWRARFAANPGVIGQPVTVDGV